MKSPGVIAALLACLATPPVLAIEVFRWVDENGVIHFSQSAPPANTGNVETMILEDSTPPGFDPDEDIFNVAAQAEQMALRREQMAERREQARLRNAQQPAPVQYAPAPIYDAPLYWGNSFFPRPPHQPQPPMRPEPPIINPYPTEVLRPLGQNQ
jgi:hypothetical protein